MLKKPRLFFIAILGLVGATTGASASGMNSVDGIVRTRVIQELKKSYPGSRIELNGSFTWSNGSGPDRAEQVTLLSDLGRGEAHVLVQGSTGTIEGTAPFSAYVSSYVALRRIYPGERLNKDLFVTQDVNVASGQAHEFRGMLLSTALDVGSLEARQTILEGQSALSTQVQRVPDVRRGDIVRLQLISGDVTLSTMGVASEPAYTGNQVKVMTQKTKRELAGILTHDGVVEVHL